MEKDCGGNIKMSYGKSAAAFVLERTMKNFPKHSRVVGSMISDFYKGLNALAGLDRQLYEAFWKLWMAEGRKRVQESNVPKDIKKLMLTVITGIARNQYRTMFITKNWASQKKAEIFKIANDRHDNDGEIKKKYLCTI
jgi:hypothetical protein